MAFKLSPNFLVLFSLLHVCLGRVFTAPEQVVETQYDFIVVGAGTAGCVVAARLTEDPAATVLLIEAGGLDNGTDSAVLTTPFLAGQGVGTQFDWNYTTTEQVGLDNRIIPYARGFVVGGSSNINSMVYIRGPSEDFDRLASVSGDPGWEWNNLVPFILKNEKHVLPWNNRSDLGEYNQLVHGNGPLLSSLTANPFELDQIVLNVTSELENDFPFNLDLNSGNGLGFGWLPTSVGNAARSSSSTAYLHPALNSRSNLDLLLHTQVTQLLATPSAPTTFTGVMVSQAVNGSTHKFTAAKEVILSAGAIGTPQILMLSGIGPSDELKTAGVTPLVDLQDVGRNLQDQPIFFLQWATTTPTLFSFFNDPAAVGAALAQYEANKTGIAASSVIFNTIGFLRLPVDSPLLQAGDPAAGPHSAHFQFSFLNTFLPNPVDTSPTEGNWMSVSVVVQSPTSVGSVNITTSSAFTHPAIDPAFMTTDFDIGTAVQAVKTLQTFMAAQAWTGFLGQPAVNLTSDAEIEAYIRSAVVTIKHPVGTARISKTGENGGVVGPDLTVKNVKGVRVVDASILPFAVAGFPQAQVYIVAERAAALIKDKWSL